MKNIAGALKIGIIGCGRVTENFHLPSLQKLNNVDVFALSDIDKYRLNKLADRFSIENRYEDPYELLNHPEIEAVAVCTPTEHHYSLGMSALSAGKHLFLEKPIALNLEESEKLVKKAADTSLKAFVGFNLRWHRHARKAKIILENGNLGTIQLIRSLIITGPPIHSEWRKNRGLGGGAILDLAIHHFDLLRYLFDTEVEEVHAKSISSDIQDQAAVVTLKTTNGLLTSSLFSYQSGTSNEIEIYGHSGSLKISFYDIDGLEIRLSSFKPGRLISLISTSIRKIRQIAYNAAALNYGGVFKESYYKEWISFIDSVINNNDAECNLEDGRCALKIALSAVESSLTGKPIKLF